MSNTISNHQYWVWESHIPKELCQQFVETYFVESEMVSGEYSDGDAMVVGPKRNTDICWVSAETFLGAKMLNHVLVANTRANWNFDIDGMEMVQVGRYGVGGHYDWHLDLNMTQKDASGMQRKLSVCLFLSDPSEYEGGDFLFRGSDTPVPKAQGTILVFPSFLEHKVTPVTEGVRYSAVSWALGPNFR